jgi:aspartyl-tRNA(Asn)/glutamyl-tRNA(Gln) amidotransferase subunit A
MLRTATECARAVREGEASPVEIAEECLRRIDRWQPVTNAFSQLRPEETLGEARRVGEAVSRGDEAGMLAGVPVAVKDLFDVAGWETTGCCAAYRGRVADGDAEAVRLLRDAGALVVGKTNMHELAAGGTNLVSACGPARNPWDPARLTGGSSGGSAAALASGGVPIALGTDTGGSIRIPSSLCGVSGLKPTHGRLSLGGVMPLAPSFDTVGPMASTVEDVAMAFAVLSGRGPRFLQEVRHPVAGLRLGLFGGTFASPVRADVHEAAEGMAGVLQEAGASLSTLRGSLGYDREDWERLVAREFFEAHGQLLERPDLVADPTRRFLERGRDIALTELEEARAGAERVRADLLAWLEDVDALVVPATPFPAPRADSPEVEVGEGEVLDVRRGGVAALTRLVNLAGLPALALPSGFSEEGLPLGAQLIGRSDGEAVLLRLGREWQERADFHRRVPPLPAEDREG